MWVVVVVACFSTSCLTVVEFLCAKVVAVFDAECFYSVSFIVYMILLVILSSLLTLKNVICNACFKDLF